MNTDALRQFRSKLAAGAPVVGLWVTLESPAVTEIAVALGLDWVVIDAEHGSLDWQEITEHLRAVVRSRTVALVRIAELNGALIKRALDVGADGVVVPWVESKAQLQQAIAFAKYPPAGKRGIGAERATAWGQAFVEHTATANDNVLVIPILETVAAEQQLAELLTVPGAELFFFGPADFSASAGFAGQWEGPGVAERILKMKAAIRANGMSCGVLATSVEDLQSRLQQGFQMVALGADTGLLIRSLREALNSLGRNVEFRANLSPPDLGAALQ